MLEYAAKLGLAGVNISDHECLASHPQAVQWMEKNREKYPNFKLALGNEIYLTETRDVKQKYYHYILIAKDAIGHKQLRTLSSIAWYNSYSGSGMTRVPTLKSEFEKVILSNPGHLIGTTACLGGELSSLTKEMIEAEENNLETLTIKQRIHNFVLWNKSIFGDDFYIECAPGLHEDQVKVNKRLVAIASAYKVKMVFGTDSHFLSAEDRPIHKAYLNSKEGDREVDDFYTYSYMMTTEEVYEILGQSISKELITAMINNSLDIYNKITQYSLNKEQKIPLVEVEVPGKVVEFDGAKYPNLAETAYNRTQQETYWAQNCLVELQKQDKLNDKYLSRLDKEAEICNYLSERIHQPLPAYFNTLQHYIDLFWEQGSIVGPGRGSAVGFLSNYLQGITQLDPVEHDLPYWRFLNKERVELPDIDIDLAPSKKPNILAEIRKNIGELNVLQVATFGTEGTRSAILTACRGYRSEEHPTGIDVDIAQYMSSMIPSHRGFLWSLHDVVYGNDEEGRKPVSQFVREVNQYPGLLDVMMSIEGLVNKRSTHAAGVIFYDGDPYETTAIMRSPSGELCTQFSLHDAEWMGDIKYDFLVTEISDKIIACIDLLTEDKLMDRNLTLREKYNKYLHPNVLPIEDEKVWKALADGSVLDVFQFNSAVGLQAAKTIKPKNPLEMTAANALMRLMGEQDKESPMARYTNMKNNINIWLSELRHYGITQQDFEILKPYYLHMFGTPCFQEDVMTILMDKNISGFTLGESNKARKTIAKKDLKEIPNLRQKFFKQCTNERIAKYVWETAIAPQLGYSFSILHSLAYSFVGIQTLVLATQYPAVYWNTACLTVNAGSADEDSDDKKTTDYAKIAKAIGDIQSRGISVSLVDINKSDFGFKPDNEHNQILFGMKGLTNVGDDLVHEIIDNRPYSSMADFLNKVPVGKLQMVALIKGGAFDNIEGVSRKRIMMKYINSISETKTRLTMQNFNGLIEKGVLPFEELEFQIRTFNYNKALKKQCKKGSYYILTGVFSDFYNKHFDLDYLEIVDGEEAISVANWDKKVYQPVMNFAREWLKNNHDEALQSFNQLIVLENWNKYCSGTLSSWEMDSVCFYHGEHELAHLNKDKYGVKNFSDLESEEVDYYFKRGGREIPIFKLNKIVGTVLSKNKSKGTVSLLTTDGVVDVKFRLEHFSLFDKQISEVQSDGSKKVMDKSWFQRGTKVMLTGYRREDQFVIKTYSATQSRSIYKIEKIDTKGNIEIRSER